jgi:glycosyltransferase involved in cell wall biosynthesis
MRILVVDEEIPYPLNSGKRIRTYCLLKPLASHHQIFFVCRQHEDTAGSFPDALERIGIQPIIVPHLIQRKAGAKFSLALLANIFSRYPYSVTSHCSTILMGRIEQLLAEHHFDLVHCEWTPYAINLDGAFGKIPTVVDAHNIEAMIWKRNFQVETHPLKKAYFYLQWKKMEAFEREYFSKFTRCIAVTENDTRAISNIVPGGFVDTISNGVDMAYFTSQKPHRNASGNNQSLVFTGSLDWRPNVDGVIYFLDRIFPLVKMRYPASKFVIVGRNPLQILKERVKGREDVILAGSVVDIRPYLNDADVYVVPLRVGGGSRLKILEAFSMELPVVSTTIGAEGLDVSDGENILIADTPTDFAAAIASLIDDPNKAEKLGKQGRIIIEAQYQWQVLAKGLEQVWYKAIGKGAP